MKKIMCENCYELFDEVQYDEANHHLACYGCCADPEEPFSGEAIMKHNRMCEEADEEYVSDKTKEKYEN